MNFFNNPVTLVIILFFIVPLINGLIRGLTPKAVLTSLMSVLEMIEMIVFIYCSIIIVRKALFEENSKLYSFVYPNLPEKFKDVFFEKDLFAYIIFVPILVFIFMNLATIILNPIYKKLFNFLNRHLLIKIEKIPVFIRRFMGLLWNIPKSIFITLIVGFLLTFMSYVFPAGEFSNWINKSIPYKNVYEYAIKPVLHSNVAKDLPLILNNAFAIDENIPEPNVPNDFESRKRKTNKNILVIEYFNGVTLNEAIKANQQIDEFARTLTAGKSTTKEKAQTIYKWIKNNITYDQSKALNIANNSKGYTSGAIVAFNTRKGICFDYSCLFIAMCRANNIKVSLVTGLAYNGNSWGDHAWNQFFAVEEKRWISVDTTFGTVANYFDKKDFFADHKYELVRQEW